VTKETAEAEIENIRILISANLTKILMLYGRLNTDYNARYLPITVNSTLTVISELEQLQEKHGNFSEILHENIERREKFSTVFNVPSFLQMDPSINGLRSATYKLASPLIKDYCKEDKTFLMGLETNIRSGIKHFLFSRTRNNCEFLSVFSQSKDTALINDLKEWCEMELLNLKT
jgi:hypothetical protein